MNKLFIGIKGHVVCLDKQTGNEIWKSKLKGMSITNVIRDDKMIYAYASGHLFCLDADFGKVLWENPLTGYGYGACIFAGDVPAQQAAYTLNQNQNQNNSQAANTTV